MIGESKENNNISRTSSTASLELHAPKINPECHQYIFTNQCKYNTFIFLLGFSIATLMTLSIEHPEEFSRITKIPTSDSLKFPLIFTIGLIFLGSLLFTVLFCYIKNLKKDKEIFNNDNEFKDIINRRNSTW